MLKVIVALLASASFSAMAANYGSAGCGLGSVVFGDKPGFTQILASTTNGSFGSQTFGMSTGTSNCTDELGMMSAASFIQSNKTALSKDIARGNGETLSALAEIYNVSNVSEMSSTLKSSYDSVFATEDSKEIASRIRTVLSERKLL